MMHEVSEQAIFVRSEPDRIAVDRHPTCAGIEPHGAAIEFALGVPSRTPQQCADARQNLLEMKRLCDVVISACIEALNLVAPAVAGSKDEDWHGSAGAPPSLKDWDAVHLGEPDVEDYRVIWFAFAEIVALFAIEGAVDHIACVSKRSCKLPVEVGIILDDEETQGQCSHRCATPAQREESASQPLLCH